MKNKAFRTVLLFAAMAASAYSDEPSTMSPAHDELRKLKTDLFDAYQARDLDKVFEYVHEDVVVTWHNAERSVGHEQIRDYYNRMMVGEDRVVRNAKNNMKVSELSYLYGDDAAIAYGTLDDEFELMNGDILNIHSNWTATCVKKDGRWLLASLHISVDMFDNPVLDTAASWLVKAAAISGIIALIVGLFIGRSFRQRSPAAEAS